MKNIQQYTDTSISEQELDTLTGELLRSKFTKEKKQKWATILENEHGIRRETAGLHVVSRRPFQRWWAIAAGLLLPLLAIVFLMKKDTSPQQMATAFLAAEQLPPSQTRKGGAETSDIQQKAIDAYSINDFDRAISEWEELKKRGKMGVEDHFFLGVSYLQVNKPDSAISSFRRFRSEAVQYTKFQQEATWYLALAYVKIGKMEDAKLELQQVAKDKDNWRKEKAEKLLKKLPK